MFKILKLAITDPIGNISHARLIALLVGFSATLFMWKLTVLHPFTAEYMAFYLSAFQAFLAYGVIHMNVSKFLDVINNVWGKTPLVAEVPSITAQTHAAPAAAPAPTAPAPTK